MGVGRFQKLVYEFFNMVLYMLFWIKGSPADLVQIGSEPAILCSVRAKLRVTLSSAFKIEFPHFGANIFTSVSILWYFHNNMRVLNKNVKLYFLLEFRKYFSAFLLIDPCTHARKIQLKYDQRWIYYT